jgi:Fe-S cluster assembly protein SufD
VLADRCASLTVVETWTSVDGADQDRLVMPSVLVDIEDGAQVTHVKVQTDSAAADHVARGWTRVGRDARYHHFVFGLGGRLVRDTHTVRAHAPGSDTQLSALWAPRRGQSMDLHTVIDHQVPDCESDQLYKCVLGPGAHGVFNGKVFVRQDAQRTAAEQLNKNLLLHPTARIDTKPQLEIFADDVTCAHGATIGRLDRDELFYLHSRGIDETNARSMLVEGFAEDVLARLDLDGLHARLRTRFLAAVASTDAESDANAGPRDA